MKYKGFFKRYHKQSIEIQLFNNEIELSNDIKDFLESNGFKILRFTTNDLEINIKARADKYETLKPTIRFLENKGLNIIYKSSEWKNENIYTL